MRFLSRTALAFSAFAAVSITLLAGVGCGGGSEDTPVDGAPDASSPRSASDSDGGADGGADAQARSVDASAAADATAANDGGGGPSGDDGGDAGAPDARPDSGPDGGADLTLAPVSRPLGRITGQLCLPGDTTCGTVVFAIDAAGRLLTWGMGVDANGTVLTGVSPTRIGNDSDWVQVASNGADACMLKRDGSRYCLGNRTKVGSSSATSPTVPTRADDLTWSTLSQGDAGGCGVLTTGRLLCWNDHGGLLGNASAADGVPTEVEPGARFTTVAVDSSSVMAIAADGSLQGWGSSYGGRNGATGPGIIAPPSWTDVDTSVGLDANGTLWTFTSLIVREALNPAQVGAVSSWDRISGGLDALGSATMCGIRSDHSLWCFGNNQEGAAGSPWLPETTMVLAPVQIEPGASFQDVAVYGHGACATHLDGTFVCWGMGLAGELGDGGRAANASSATWRPLHEAYTFVDLASPATGLTAAGDLVQWGVAGQYGASPTEILVPRGAPSTVLSGVTAFSSRSAECALDATGAVSCERQTNDTPDGATYAYDYVYLANPQAAGWSKWSANSSHECGIDTEGALACLGSDLYGELGDGRSAGSVSDPVAIAAGQTWSGVAVGADASCAVATDGGLWCWGHNDVGQLADGTDLDHDVPTQAGTDTDWIDLQFLPSGLTACGRKTDHSVWCWGPSPTTPTAPPSLSPVLVAAGPALDFSYPYLLGDDGSVSTFAGQELTAVPGATKIAAGWDGKAVCVLQASGQALCQGANDLGDLGDPYTWSYVPVAVTLP